MSSLGQFSTAQQVADRFASDCKGKTIIVTGANSGIGYETTKALASHGATVILACRSASKAAKAVDAILADYPNAKLSLMLLDLASLDSIRAFAIAFEELHPRLHVLVNNAGLLHQTREFTQDGFEMSFGVNHLGPLYTSLPPLMNPSYLTRLLLPLLKKSGCPGSPARVVNVSSLAQYVLLSANQGVYLDDIQSCPAKGYSPWRRYASSKLANVLFSRALNQKMKQESGGAVVSVSLHPGTIPFTQIALTMPTATAVQVLWVLAWARPSSLWKYFIWGNEVLKSLEQGAATSVMAAVDPGIIGGLHYQDCQISKWVHETASSEEAAARLWDISSKLVGL